MSIALRQSQMDIFGFISLFPSGLFHEARRAGRRSDGRDRWQEDQDTHTGEGITDRNQIAVLTLHDFILPCASDKTGDTTSHFAQLHTASIIGENG